MVVKLSSQENPQRFPKQPKSSKYEKQNQKWFKKYVIQNHFGSIKNIIWFFTFLEPFQDVEKGVLY